VHTTSGLFKRLISEIRNEWNYTSTTPVWLHGCAVSDVPLPPVSSVMLVVTKLFAACIK